MQKPLSLFIGYRYTKSKQRNHFISFISLASILGVALGVTTLITVLSVMNGFEKEISSKLLGMVAHNTLLPYNGRVLDDWPKLEKKIVSVEPEIKHIAPFTQGQGMLTKHGQVKGILVEGISPEHEKHITEINSKFIQGELGALKPGEFNILIGSKLAHDLNLGIGSKLTLVLPEPAMSIIGITPRFKRFTVGGIFQVDSQFDHSMSFIHIEDASKLFYRNSKVVGGLKMKTDNLYAAPRIGAQLRESLDHSYYVTDWTENHGNYFEAVKLEKTIMFLMLLLIIAVAAFNIVSTLVMVVTDKRSEIAILRTIGATPKLIMKIFMVQGAIIGLVGTFLGLIGGVTLALTVTDIIAFIENLLEVQFLSSDVYYISFLPSDLQWPDVIKICFTSLVICFFATLYPAWKASKIQPAEALRYD